MIQRMQQDQELQNIDQVPPLFGHWARTALLLDVARQGPCHGRAAARRTGVEVAHASRIISDFTRMGVLVRAGSGNRPPVMLNEEFFAFPELVALLRGLSGQRVVVLGAHLDAPPSNAEALSSLFGSGNRTRLLVALRAVASANVKQLSFITGVPPGSATSALDFFQTHGIIRSEALDNERVVQLDAGFRYGELLSRFLERLAEAFPRIVNAAAYLREHVNHMRADDCVAEPEGWRPELMPIGEAAQARVLYQLAIRGPVSCAALAKASGLTVNTTRSAVLSLERFGMVTQKTFGNGYHRKRWSALNPAHPLTAPIERYARDLSSLYPYEQLYRLPPKGFPAAPPQTAIAPALPGMSLRLRVLMAVFASPGIDVKGIRIMLGELSQRRIKSWLRYHAAAGFIDFGMSGARYVARPSERFHAAATLRDLIKDVSAFLNFRPVRRVGSRQPPIENPALIGRAAPAPMTVKTPLSTM